MNRCLYIVRGPQGSGKSTLARLLTEGRGGHAYEADSYHMVDGEYRWRPANVPAAHASCKRQVEIAMQCGAGVIAVANTFSQWWEIEPYIDLADAHKYTVQIVEVSAGGRTDEELERRNVHSVPAASIAKVRQRWEPLLQLEQRLRARASCSPAAVS